MPTDQKTQQICSKFQRYLKNNDKSLIEQYSLNELETADTDLGWRDQNSSYRMALKKRIDELRQEDQERKDARRHKQNLFMVGLSVFVAIIIAVIGWLYFSE